MATQRAGVCQDYVMLEPLDYGRSKQCNVVYTKEFQKMAELLNEAQ
jgi:hypothetical protein